MYPKYSDTIAREQQIRELTQKSNVTSPAIKVQTSSDESRGYLNIIVGIIQLMLAISIIGRFAISNGALIRAMYHSLINTSNETSTEIPEFLRKIR